MDFKVKFYVVINLNLSGRSDFIDNFSFVNGCIKSNLAACKYNPLPFKISDSVPYS